MASPKEILDSGDANMLGVACKKALLGTVLNAGGVRLVTESVAVSSDAATPTFTVKALLFCEVTGGSASVRRDVAAGVPRVARQRDGLAGRAVARDCSARVRAVSRQPRAGAAAHAQQRQEPGARQAPSGSARRAPRQGARAARPRSRKAPTQLGADPTFPHTSSPPPPQSDRRQQAAPGRAWVTRPPSPGAWRRV